MHKIYVEGICQGKKKESDEKFFLEEGKYISKIMQEEIEYV